MKYSISIIIDLDDYDQNVEVLQRNHRDIPDYYNTLVNCIEYDLSCIKGVK